MKATTRRRYRRMELRTTTEERDSIYRVLTVTEGDLIEFVTPPTSDAQRVLADRYHFGLDPGAAKEWEQINSRRARDLPALQRLAARPSTFSE